MEVGLDPRMPTYSGGLGVLAGDTLRAAADLGLHMIGITLLHRKGYFRQHLDAHGNQTESPAEWDPAEFMAALEEHASVNIEGRRVAIRPWRYNITSAFGNEVTLYFLDTDLPENSEWDRTLTDYLYGGDDHYRLCQETVLGLGGVAILRLLGYDIAAFHMNEGHSALLCLALLREEAEKSGLELTSVENIERVRQRCVFTTHTPVPAGIDKFPISMIRQVLGDDFVNTLGGLDCIHHETLNMIYLALSFSRYINGVSMRHEEISRDLFPNYPINSITNGVHALTWTSMPFRRLYDRYIPEWRNDNLYLRYAIGIPRNEIRQAHLAAKQELLSEVKRRTGFELNPAVMTIGFARRMTLYKRADLLFADINRLKKIAREVGPLQVLYAGKAHPHDEGGKALIRQVFQAAEELKGTIPVIFLENYDIELAALMCSGVDLWLNTPQRPLEASGTSGMKAALNGVPSLSVLDGWWMEGHIEGVTGWAIDEPEAPNLPSESVSLYNKLQNTIVPLFYHSPEGFESVMRAAVAINGSYYNAQRMIFQYMEHAYLPPSR